MSSALLTRPWFQSLCIIHSCPHIPHLPHTTHTTHIHQPHTTHTPHTHHTHTTHTPHTHHTHTTHTYMQEKDDANFKLMSERIKYNSVQKVLLEEKELLQSQINAINTEKSR